MKPYSRNLCIPVHVCDNNIICDNAKIIALKYWQGFDRWIREFTIRQSHFADTRKRMSRSTDCPVQPRWGDSDSRAVKTVLSGHGETVLSL